MEGYSETLQDHVERIRTLEQKVRELEWLKEQLANLKQVVDMIKFRARHR